MPKKIVVQEPEMGLKFIDVHCHLPFHRPKNDRLPTDKEQYSNYFKMGGQYLITSTIDIQTLDLTLNFMKNFDKNFGLHVVGHHRQLHILLKINMIQNGKNGLISFRIIMINILESANLV